MATKYDSTDLIPEEFRDQLSRDEVFIDDIGDETWASIRYLPDEGAYSLYVDARLLGKGFEKSVVTIRVDAQELTEKLAEATLKAVGMEGYSVEELMKAYNDGLA